MPGSILNADIGFPAFTGTESSEDKIGQITNYLYMLLEQLRYSFANIGVDNINPGEMTKITEIVNNPINIQIGNMSSSISGLSDSISGLTGSVGSLNLRVGSAEGSITRIQAFNDGLTLSVQNGQESSIISLKSGSATLASKEIRFLGQVVFASDLTDGTTVISGSNIQTGRITGIDIRSGVFEALLDSYGGYTGEIKFWYGAYPERGGVLAGGLKFDDNGAGTAIEASKRLILYTEWPAVVLKLESAGNISIEAAGGSTIYIGGNDQTVSLDGTVKINGVVQ